MTHPKSHYHNKVVYVTGAGGSIGSEICRRLVEYEVAKLIMVGHSEIALYKIERELRDKAPAGAIVTVLGSVTDEKLMGATLQGADIVIHAAAHKHIPLCEENPLEAITNNVGGTVSLAQAASMAGVGQFIMVSSDKAVKPKSIMGATKRACELFVQFLAARSSTRFCVVRFGNVLDSSGSVLPLWREQLRQGKPITLTDKRCTRYFMSIPEAVDLTLGAGSLPRGGLYVLDMGEPKSLYQMALNLVSCTAAFDAKGFKTDPGPHKIIETGLRPGEKLTEELSYGGELVKTALPKVLLVREDARRVLKWHDFSDLLMATKCRHRQMALEMLWSIVQ